MKRLMPLKEEFLSHFLSEGSKSYHRGPHEEAPGLGGRQEQGQGEGMAMAFTGVSARRQGGGDSLGLAGFSDSSGPWGIEAVPSWLGPSPGFI